jgi:hypothetical protein
MMFGTLTLNLKEDTLIITPATAESFRHYPGTDITERFYMGRPATIIRCTVSVASDADLIALRAVCHADVSAYLYLAYAGVTDGQYYADTSGSIQDERFLWPGHHEVTMLFTASDPVPYLTSTGARLY